MAEQRAKAFVCGHPIAHSRSPMIHGHWLRQYRDRRQLRAHRCRAGRFPRFLQAICKDRGFAGGNVTIPHKEAAFALVASRDEAAELIGAVNTLWLEDGMVCGGNTDAHGFAANLDECAPGWERSRRGRGARRRRRRAGRDSCA